MKLKPLLKKLQKPLFILLGAFALTAILLNIEFNLVEAELYDFRMTTSYHDHPSSEIVLITIDKKTIQQTHDFAPLPLDLHTKFFENIQAFKPKAIGYLVNMNNVSQVDPSLFESEWSNRFILAARRMITKGTPVLMGTHFDVNGEVLPPYPISSLPHGISIIHKDGNVFSGDNVTRRALGSLYQKPSFHMMLAQEAGYTSKEFKPRGTFALNAIDSEFFYIRYHGNPNAALLEENSNSPYKQISFSDILKNNVSPDQINGKILLVGTLLKENPSDYTKTPYSKNTSIDPKLVIHANILNTIIDDDAIIKAPQWLDALFIFIASSLTIYWVTRLTPLLGVLATIVTATGISLISILFFQELIWKNGIWINLTQSLLAIFISYYLLVPYRLMREYSKRWNLQKKNEVLLQVEKLKSNFLSLVTHDLKTPVARVQGLAEVIQKKESSRLTEKAKQNLDQIISATDDLNRFISSILELSKAESSELKPNFESKDINHLIEQVILGFVPQARTKSIKIRTHLEPLFPIKCDPLLISKVLNNLIDNAIKYSPKGSIIHVRSFEIDSIIQIEIEDQGMGLTEDEQKRLFTRFYRGTEAKQSTSGGSGLGLYLSKFFIEAHQGNIFVKCKENVGSTFIIQLPLEMKTQEETVKPGLKKAINFTIKRRRKDV